MERTLLHRFTNNSAPHNIEKVTTSQDIYKNTNISSVMDGAKYGSRSEQGFRLEGLKQSIIAVYGDAMDKIGFSITEKANRSAQSRLGKTLRSLETMEYKEQALYRRQKQELLDSLDRLQGEQLRIRKLKHQQHKVYQKQTKGYKVYTIPDESSVQEYEHASHQDDTDGDHEHETGDGPSQITRDPSKITASANLIALMCRPSSTVAAARKQSEDQKYLQRPLTPEVPCRLPKLNAMQSSLIVSGCQNAPTNSVLPKTDLSTKELERLDEMNVYTQLQQDSIDSRERRSASFSQYGNLQRPKLARETRCVSPLVSKTKEPSAIPQPPKHSIKAHSQSNSPLLPKRQLWRGNKDWIPPDKEDLLAELEDYKKELQERVNQFLAKQNPQ